MKVVRTSPRIGVGRARNLGAAAAHGEFVAFLDDDDTWEPRHLSCLAGAIGEKPKSVAVGTIVLVDERGTQLSRTLLPASPELQRTLYFRNPGFGGCNFMIRREAFLALGGFDESFPASEDRDLAVRLIENGYHLVPVPEAVVYALEHRQERSRPHHLKGNALFLRKHWRAMTWDERRRCVQRIAGRARNRLFDELKRPLRRWITRAS
ncbi:MAG TPA: glycosyltransferase [Alphaproteobacteria bacterium]|nr:glycosyltransferase [Alphaproteobacteria bacterium]